MLYARGVELFGTGKFREAAGVLEEAKGVDEESAAVCFTLGAVYSRIGGECGRDEVAVAGWLRKSGEAFAASVDLAERNGGLSVGQLDKARLVVASCAPYMRGGEGGDEFMNWNDIKKKYGEFISGEPEDGESYRATLHVFYRDYAHADRVLSQIPDAIAGKLRPVNEGVSTLSGGPRYHVTHEGTLTGEQVREYLETTVGGGGEVYEVFL